MLKVCSKCKEEKLLKDYYKDCSKKDKCRSSCKTCENKIKLEKYHSNLELFRQRLRTFRENNPGKIKKWTKEQYYKNRDKYLEQNKIYRENNKDLLRVSKKKYYEANKDIIKERRKGYSTRARKNSIQKRIADNLRNRLYYALKDNYKSGSAVRDLGCTIAEFKRYLESRFLPGMSWENYGLHGWHIDHIIPISSFDLTKRENLLKACHYTNLQPLWASDNLKKSNKHDPN